MTNSDKSYEEIKRRRESLRWGGSHTPSDRLLTWEGKSLSRHLNEMCRQSCKGKDPRIDTIHGFRKVLADVWRADRKVRERNGSRLVRRLTWWSQWGMTVAWSRPAVVRKQKVCGFGIFFEGCVNNNPWSPGYSSFHLIRSFVFLSL